MVKRSRSAYMERTGKRARTSKPVSRSYIAKTTRQVVLRMAEKKVATVLATEIPVSSAFQGSNWLALTNIAQGTGHGARVGREIRLDSIHIKNVLHNNATGTHLARVVVGYSLDQTVPGLSTELFEGGARSAAPDTFGTGTSGLATIIQPINKAKFRTVYDRVHNLGAVGSLDGSQVKHFTINKKLGGTKINFEADSSGISNQDKALYIGVWTAEGGNDAGATGIEWTSFASLKFTDL